MSMNLDASGQTIQGLDFSGAMITEKSFTHRLFEDCNFSNAKIGGSLFEGCLFSRCSLTDGIFEFCDLSSVMFDHCDLIRSAFHDCYMPGLKITNSCISLMKASSSFIDGSVINGCTGDAILNNVGRYRDRDSWLETKSKLFLY